MAASVAGGVLFALALPIDHGNYMLILHAFYGAVIGVIVGVTIWVWLGYMVYRDKNAPRFKRRKHMKHLLLATIAPVLLVGFICYNFNWGLTIHRAAELGYIEVVKQHLDAGVIITLASTTIVLVNLFISINCCE